jgi:PAS domain S-box-containing protein
MAKETSLSTRDAEIEDLRAQLAAALSNGDAKYRALVESSLDAIFVITDDGDILAANPAACAMYGYTEEEFKQLSRSGLADVQDPRFVAALAARTQTGHFAGEVTQIRKNGQKFTGEVTIATFTDQNGLVRFSIIVRDVTERKVAEAQLASALAEAQQRAAETEAIYNSLNDAVLIYDRERNVVKANPAFQAAYGFDPIGLNVRDIIQRVNCRWLDGRPLVLEDQPTPRALRGEKVAGARYLIRPPGAGADLMVETASAPLVAGDQVVGSVTIWHDITERERLLGEVQVAAHELRAANETLQTQAEELQAQNEELSLQREQLQRAEGALRQARDQLEATFASMAEAVLVYDLGGNVSRANPAAFRLLGFNPLHINMATMPHRLSTRHMDGRRLLPIEAPSARALRGETVVDERYRLTRPDGREVIVVVAVAPLLAAGRVSGAVTVMHDVTEQEQAQAQLEESKRLLDALMASVPEGITLADTPDMRIRMVSRYGQELLGAPHAGLTIEQVTTQWQVFHKDGVTPMAPDDLPLARAALKGETVEDQELVQVDTHGRRLPLLCNAAPIRNQQGTIVGSIVTWRDITERVRAEQARQQVESALAQSEERYRTLFNGMTEGFALHDIICDEQGAPCDYRFVTVNPAFERLTGLMRDDVAGRLKSQIEALRGDDPKWLEIYGQVALCGESVHFENYSPPLERWYEVYAYCPTRGQFAVIFTDITQRKQVEQERERLLAQLEAEKTRWQATVENMLDPVTVADAEGRAIYMNAAYSRLVERHIDPALDLTEHADFYQLYRPDGTLFPVEDLPLQRAALTDANVQNVEIVQRTPGGADRVVIWNAAPLHHTDGSVVGSVAVGRDITAQRQAERALQAQTETLLEQAHMLDLAHVLVRNLDDAIIFWNRGAEALYGWTKAEAVGQNSHVLFQTVFPDSMAAVRQALQETGYWEGELLHTRRDGSQVVVASHQVLHRDKAGHPIAIIEVNNDVTALKLAKEQLREARDELEVRVQERTSELQDANAILEEEIEERRRTEEIVRQHAQRLAAVADTSHALVEAGFNVQAMLDQAARALGLHIGDVCVIRLLSADAQQLELAAVRQADPDRQTTLRALLAAPVGVTDGTAGRAFQTRAPVFLPSLAPVDLLHLLLPVTEAYLGHNRVAALIVVPLMTQTDVLGTLAVYRWMGEPAYTAEDLKLLESIADRVALAVTNARLHRDLETALAQEVTIRQQLIQAEKLGALGRMVGSVAHELNNPLQTITNCLYLTDKELTPDSPIHDFLEMAQAETRRLVDLVAQLRELYRLRPAGAPQARRLSELLQDVQALLAPQLRDAHVQWRPPASGLEYAVPVIHDRLKQVFINLAANAIEAMWPGGGQLEVDLVPSADGRQAAVKFHDTGPGIPPENLERLFEPFFTTKAHGLGLGLAICYEIVQQHGGQITVDSQPGQGTTFTVWLPLVQGD